jgi:hypothetical protein
MGGVGHRPPLNFFDAEPTAVASRDCRKSTSRRERCPTPPNDSSQGRQRRLLGLGRDACPSPVVASLAADRGRRGSSFGTAGRAELAGATGAAADSGGRWAAADRGCSEARSGSGASRAGGVGWGYSAPCGGFGGEGFKAASETCLPPKKRAAQAGCRHPATGPARRFPSPDTARTHPQLRPQPGSRPPGSRARACSCPGGSQRRLDGVRATLSVGPGAPLGGLYFFGNPSRCQQIRLHRKS